MAQHKAEPAAPAPAATTTSVRYYAIEWSGAGVWHEADRMTATGNSETIPLPVIDRLNYWRGMYPSWAWRVSLVHSRTTTEAKVLTASA